MTKRFITDKELTIAAAMVSESMLRALPEPEECTGQLTAQFEENIEQLKKTAARKAGWKKFGRSVMAAVLVVLIGFSMLCAFNAEVHAAVVTWFKETCGTKTTYWFTSEAQNELPAYKLTWIPDGYELIIDDTLPESRTLVYQLGDDVTTSFSYSYYLAEDDSPLTIYTFDGEYTMEEVYIDGRYGEFYKSHEASVSNAFIWLDKKTNTVNTIIAYLPKNDILDIANGIKILY